MIQRIYAALIIAQIMVKGMGNGCGGPTASNSTSSNASIFHFYGTKYISKASYIKLIPNDEEARKSFGFYYFLQIHVELNQAAMGTIGQVNVTKLGAFTDAGKRQGKRMLEWCQQTFYIDKCQRVRMRGQNGGNNNEPAIRQLRTALPGIGMDKAIKEWNFLLTNLASTTNRIDGAYGPKEIVGHTIVLSHFNKLLGCVVPMPTNLEYWRATFSARHMSGIVGAITFLNLQMTNRRKSQRKMFTRILIELNWTNGKSNGGGLQWFLSSEMCGGATNFSPKSPTFRIQIPSGDIFDFGDEFLFQPQIHKNFCFSFVMNENFEERKGNAIRCIQIQRI